MPACGPCATCSRRRRDPCHGLRALWPRGSLHAPGVLPAPRHRLDRCRDRRSRRNASKRFRRTIRSRRCCAHRPTSRAKAGLADALLHPQDRAYSVPQLMEFLDRADLAFGRWVRQAPYLPWCGAIASTPHQARLAELDAGRTICGHRTLSRNDGPPQRRRLRERRAPRASAPSTSTAMLGSSYVPIRLPDTLAVRDRLPAGASAVLINRNHTYTDLYLPIDARQERLLEAIDGERTIARHRPRDGRPRPRARVLRATLALGPDRLLNGPSPRSAEAGKPLRDFINMTLT